MKHQIKINPLSVKGKYYVDENTCLHCVNCDYYAPDNFKTSNDGECFVMYFSKQPETPEEEALVYKAMQSCPVEAIYDGGEKVNQ